LKIILFANTAWYLYNFRLPLAIELKKAGWDVTLISPPDAYGERLCASGLRWLPFNLSRRGVNPFGELLTLCHLARLYHIEKPDFVHHFTIKCVIYGSIAAKLSRIQHIVNAVTGLGYIFIGSTFRFKVFQRLARFFYRFSLRDTQVIFQNRDDMKSFIKDGLVSPQKAIVIRGSGVDTATFSPESQEASIPMVVLVARLLWDKGVGEFVEAARMLRKQGSTARFVLVGDSDPHNPAAVPPETIENWRSEAIVEVWGWKENVLSIYRQAQIVCLPSYREGTPRTLLEAAACARAIVATDVPGCREVVNHGINGLLVPLRDPQALAEALNTLLSDPHRCQSMGEEGRKLAVREFSQERVIADTMKVYTTLSG
jgi:glycosyltransferase involved in cell wall biosynthesis